MLVTCLLTAIGSLSTALGVLWRQGVAKDRRHEAQLLAMRVLLDNQHADHLADIKELTREQIALAKTLMSAPPLAPSVPQLPASKD